jgi:PKD repeat protein
MLYWADPEAAANAAKALVNDLDITVTGPGGTVYRPWKLNPTPNATILDTPAGTGRDSLNNAEQVAIFNPTAGNYTVTIKGFEVPQGPQTYYLLWEYLDDQVQITYPVGGDALTPGSNVWIRWDAYGNTDPFTLRYSNNGGASFSTIASPANSDRMYNWTVPNVTSGKVKLLLIRGSNRDTTDYDFTIAPQPGSLTVTRVCPDSVTLSWTKVNNPALAYDVYVLGQKYMEIKTTTAANVGSAKVPISNPLAENWFSIRARDNDGLLGQRINAVKWPGGLLGCSQNQDLALVTMVEPAEDYLLACDPVSRQVTVRVANNGLLTASGAIISYQLGAGAIIAEPLPDIPSGAVLDFTFATPLEFNENGVQTLNLNVQFTGDLLLADNQLSKSYTVVVKSTDMPFLEDFEASGNLPAGWSIENPDGFTTWFLDQAVQADGSTGRVVRINHYSYSNPSNQQDYLNLAPLDLGQFSKPWLNFEYSHALYNSNYTDGLRVEIFPDCDRNATPLVVWEKFDPELAVLTTTSSFTPANASEWRRDSVSLEAWAGSRVYVRFTAINGYGNNTFLNNIQLRDLAPPQAQFSTEAYFCAGIPQSFSAAPSPGFDNSYTWNFGPGATTSSATGAGPHQVIFQGSNQAQVQLIVKNAAGADTATLTVPVYDAPTVAFDASTAGAEVQFTSSATQADTWAWDFGDGASSSNPNPQHTYATEGVYTVTLTVQGLCGTATAIQTVFALNTPVAGFEATPAQGCAPLSVSFTNTSSDNSDSFQWTIEGGTPSSSTDVHPVVIFEQPGVYTVQLLAENALGNAAFTSTIVVGAGPTAQFTSIASGKNAVFSNSSMNAGTYTWDFGDGQTSTQANPTHQYDEDGVYTVTLTTYNTCGSATFSETVTIATPPLANFNSEQATGCAPFSVAFTNLSSSNSSAFEWEFPGGIPASSTETNPVVVYPVAGAYSVTLRAINAQGVSENTQPDKVVVLGGPEAAFDTQTILDTLFCNNTSINATSYLWSFGDGNTSTEATPMHQYSADGMYTLMLIAFNDCGADTLSGSVSIVTPPVADFSVNGGSGCTPLEVTFNNEASDNATDFLWSFPGGTPAASAEKSPTVVYEQAGVYSVILHVGNTAGTSSIEKTDVIVVNSAPVAGFTLVTDTSSVQFFNYSNGASSYFWQFGDGNTSTEFEPQHTYGANGVYVITLSATNECGSSIISDTAQVVVSALEDIRQGIGKVQVFPNPNQGRFNLWITETSGEEVEIYLMDPLGRQLHRQIVQVNGSELRTVLDYQSLPSGVYSLNFRQAKNTGVVKLMVNGE